MSDEQIISSGSKGGLNMASRVRLDTLERVTPDGVQGGGWIASKTNSRTPSWIQVVVVTVVVGLSFYTK